MNHYETLGLDKDCSAKDIRKAYRKLAAEHHPDRGGDAARFAAIAAAHETLSDPVSRKHYDETGEDPGPANSYSAPQKIVIKAIAKFATQPHGDLFEDPWIV